MLVTWRYKPRKSLIQSFDPRAWLIFYACFLASTILFWDIRFQLVLFVITFVTLVTSGIKFKEMKRAWIFIGGFVVFFSLLTFLTGRGGVELYTEDHLLARVAANFKILGWQPKLTITAEKTMYALTMLVRVFSLASMTILIPYSLNPAHYGITFRGLGLPDKVAYGMDLTMRFIPSFGRDFMLTRDAQRARGYELEKISGGIFATVRKLAPLIVPVTIHAIVGSEDIIDAMDLRAFGVDPRTWLEQLKYRKRDRFLIAFGVVLIALSIGLSLLGFGNFWVPQFLLNLAV